MQKVKIYLSISGDYCAFHEMQFEPIYDITNKKYIGLNSKDEYSLTELKNWKYGDYEDIQKVDAYLIDGVYYYNL